MRHADGSPAREVLGPLVTERLRVLLERGPVRIAVIGMLLVVASVIRLVSEDVGIQTEWIFIIPVAIASIAAGLREGLLTALIASLLHGLYGGLSEVFATTWAETAATINNPEFVQAMVTNITGQFALNGIIALILGAFAEAHYSVQHHLRQLASLDPLTKVSNIELFFHELRLLEASGQRYVVMVCDLDDLKALNDRYGHQTGSLAIQMVANVLRQVTRASDCVARYGGDEFVVILKEADRSGAQIVANRARRMLGEQKVPGAPKVKLGVSIGVALSGEDGTTSEELLASADKAMYAAKRVNKEEAATVAVSD